MNVLLDTHALIWFYDGSPLLSQAGRAAIEGENNRPFLSAASFVEIGIKISLGKLRLSSSTTVIPSTAYWPHRLLPKICR